MTEHNITLAPGSTKVLHTAGTYCDRDIVVTAENGEYYDAFWDAYQENGNRKNYTYAFAGPGWTDETFKPKYDIKQVGAFERIFANTSITDLAKLLDDAGVSFDLSGSNGGTYICTASDYLQTLPELDCRNMREFNYFIYNCTALHSIKNVILKSDGTQTFNISFAFGVLPVLEEIRFEGVIGKNFGIPGSPLLSTESVDSIITALKDLQGATQQTLALHADVVGRMTQEQKDAIAEKNWTLG